MFSERSSFMTSAHLWTICKWVFLGSNKKLNTSFYYIHSIRKDAVNALLVLNILKFLMMLFKSRIPWIRLSKKEDLKHNRATSSFSTSVCFSLSSLVISLRWKLSILLMILSIFSLLTFLRLFSGASLSDFLHTSTNLGPYSWMNSLW